MRMSDVPTLLVGHHSRSAYRRPLIAVEIDPSARNLIELTRRMLGSSEVPLRILHAYTVPFESYFRANRDSSGAAYFREARKNAEAAMAAMLASTGSQQLRVETVLRRGEAGSAILNEAVRYRADLIALGTHGRSGVAHMLLGSVAEWVIECTSRDVLVARPVRFTFVPP
jgi:nucleotide-binding universal stress UspA family protein